MNERGNGNPRSSMVVGGIPQRVRRKLRYCEFFTLAGTSTVVSREYGMNCLYDPYLGTGGHQPSGFDTYMRMYAHYNVLNCSVTMRYMNDATGSSQPAVFGMIGSSLGGEVTVAGTITYLAEQGRAVLADIPAGITNAPVSRPLHMKWSISDFADGADTRGMPTYWGTASTNPTSIAYVEVFHGSTAGATTGTFTYQVILDYDIEFWLPLGSVNSFSHMLKCDCGKRSPKGTPFCSECGARVRDSEEKGEEKETDVDEVLASTPPSPRLAQASQPVEAEKSPPPVRSAGWFG